MNIEIVFPTKNRPEALKKCLASLETEIINPSPHIFTVIPYVDSKKEYDYIKANVVHDLHSWVHVRVLETPYNSACKFWNDYLKNFDADAFVYLNDDCEVEEGCLENAAQILETQLDYDGIVGFKQTNANCDGVCLAAFGMVGYKYLESFPNNALFCPDYYCLYADQELYEYALKSGRFIYSENCKIKHFHPTFTGLAPDETHKTNKLHKGEDIKTFRTRRSLGLLWGVTTEVVNESTGSRRIFKAKG